MKTMATSLQFCEPTPVTEEKCFQNDVAIQINDKFQIVFFIFILSNVMPKYEVISPNSSSLMKYSKLKIKQKNYTRRREH